MAYVPKSPGKQGAVHWYNQFLKQFLRPYGKIDAPLQNKLINEN